MSKLPSLHVETEGEGETLVCLHGFLESSTMWKYLPMEQLSFRKVYIDLPGHGKSPIIDDLPPSVQAMAECVDKTLREQGIQKYSLIGHSMGGYVALQLLYMNAPVDKLILLNSNCYSDSETKRNDRIRVADAVYHTKNLFLNTALPNLFRDPVKNKMELNDLLEEASHISADAIAYASLAMSQRTDHCELLRKNIEKVYILQGEDDAIVPTTDSDRIFGDFEGHYFKIKEAGHMSHIENPNKVMNVLKSILEK